MPTGFDLAPDTLFLCVPALSRSIAENFRTKILNEKESDASSGAGPVRTFGSVTFLTLRHADLYVLALVTRNANVMLGFKFMTSVSPLHRSASGPDLCCCINLDFLPVACTATGANSPYWSCRLFRCSRATLREN